MLLTANQPTLIDDFGLQTGAIAPGWTPDWSPPEQVLGNPVTPAADIYPLGIMLLLDRWPRCRRSPEVSNDPSHG